MRIGNSVSDKPKFLWRNAMRKRKKISVIILIVIAAVLLLLLITYINHQICLKKRNGIAFATGTDG